MTTRVIMNTTRPNGSGGQYLANTEYNLPDDLAEIWRGQGICRRVSVRSEQTGAVVSADAGDFPDSISSNPSLPVMATPSGSGIEPRGIAPSGTVAADGAITLGTALPATFAQIMLYLPAGAISGGAAGFYAVEMSSTTVGVVRERFGGAALVGSGSAYTGVTTEQTLASYEIQGGSLSKVRLEALLAQSNSAGTKTVKAKYGAGQMLNSPATTTPEQTFAIHLLRISSGVQHSANAAAAGGTSLAAWLTTDDSVNQPLIVTGQIAVATDYLICVSSTLINLG